MKTKNSNPVSVGLLIIFTLVLSFSCSDSEYEPQSDEHPDFIKVEANTEPISGKANNNALTGSTSTDQSGTIETELFFKDTWPHKHKWTDEKVTVPAGYVCIGGGVITYGNGQGAFVTASYPSSDKKSWVVSTKDHVISNPHVIRVYAIGLKLDGVSESNLKNYINHYSASTGSAAHPTKSVIVPSNYTMIGGGAKVNWSGAGNLLVTSGPVNTSTWGAKSKDHVHHSPASLTVYAIGLSKNIPNYSNIQAQTYYASSYSSTGNGSVSLRVPNSDYAFTSCGARNNYTGWGRLLRVMSPNGEGSGASNKDHVDVSGGTLYTYAIGIKK